MLGYGEPPRSNVATTRSTDLNMSGIGATVPPTNTASIAQPPTENYQQRLVRAMSSNAAAGMTPFGGSQDVGTGRGRLRILGNSELNASVLNIVQADNVPGPFRRRNVREQPGPGFALMLETANAANNTQPVPTSPTRPLSENASRANAKVASIASGTVKAAKDAESSSGESEL